MSAGDAPFMDYAARNGVILATSDMGISPLAPGFMYGEGFFETVAVRDERPRLLAEHHARLAASLHNVGTPPTSSCGEMHTRCARVIAANGLVNGSLKIVAFRDQYDWTEMIFARCAGYHPEDYKRGFRLLTLSCDLRVDTIHNMKSLNYYENILSRRVALDAGFDDTLLFDSNRRVLEGTMTNVFIVKDCVISTPALDAGILPGVMRARIIKVLPRGSVRERAIDIDEIPEADEVFVTNALLGVMPVALIDRTSYGLEDNLVTRSITAAMAKAGG